MLTACVCEYCIEWTSVLCWMALTFAPLSSSSIEQCLHLPLASFTSLFVFLLWFILKQTSRLATLLPLEDCSNSTRVSVSGLFFIVWSSFSVSLAMFHERQNSGFQIGWQKLTDLWILLIVTFSVPCHLEARDPSAALLLNLWLLDQQGFKFLLAICWGAGVDTNGFGVPALFKVFQKPGLLILSMFFWVICSLEMPSSFCLQSRKELFLKVVSANQEGSSTGTACTSTNTALNYHCLPKRKVLMKHTLWGYDGLTSMPIIAYIKY